MRSHLTSLVRIRITLLNPYKRDVTGEFFTVGNDYILPLTRYIPFNATDHIWHVERIFIPMLKSKKYLDFTPQGKDNNICTEGDKMYKPEFSIDILPPLTEEELDRLKDKQNKEAFSYN